MERSLGRELLSPGRVGEILGLSKPHVYNLAKTGEIPSIKFRRAVRFDPRDVEEFIRRHRRQNTA